MKWWIMKWSGREEQKEQTKFTLSTKVPDVKHFFSPIFPDGVWVVACVTMTFFPLVALTSFTAVHIFALWLLWCGSTGFVMSNDGCSAVFHSARMSANRDEICWIRLLGYLKLEEGLGVSWINASVTLWEVRNYISLLSFLCLKSRVFIWHTDLAAAAAPPVGSEGFQTKLTRRAIFCSF